MTGDGTYAVTWWGHATTTIEIGGVRILTDPVLTQRLGHLGRVTRPPLLDSARADVALISHLHSDHLHVPSLRRLHPNTRVIAPLGARQVVERRRGWSGDLCEVEVGDLTTYGTLSIRAVPAAHDGRRHPRSRIQGAALGYVIEHDGTRIWFAGDTGLFTEMTGIGPVDLAIVPIGGWGPSLDPAEHMGPADAVEAVRRVGARQAVPMHYGTLWPIGLRRLHPPSYRRYFVRPGGVFAQAMAASLPLVSTHVLAPGEGAAWQVGS